MRWVVRAIPVLAAMFEVFWAYPWLSWLGTWPTLAWPRPPLTLVSALALVVMAEEVSRFTLDSHWSLRRMRLITLALMVAALVTVVRLELGGGYALWDAGWVQHASANLSSLIGGFVFGAYLLWRGISVGREPLQCFDAYPRVLFGLAALVALLVVRAGSSGVGPGLLASSGYIIAYFFIGLLTLALINLR
ncbi:MAG: hypothetical protein HYX95_00400, partial [Chloroflexi bacterium]|nr:hypothetical protein [Chloroflexota bacterium]